MTMGNILEVENLQKSFALGGIPAVAGVSFSIAEGECVGLVGRSGCGKSTTARLALRLLAPDAGRIRLMGKDITHLRGASLRAVYDAAQMVFQQPEESFDPRKTLGWSIGEPLLNRGVRAHERAARITDLLQQVGLDDSLAARYPHEVSGGECQRAALARALAPNPRLLVCDEITSALDTIVQADIVRLVGRLCQARGMACLFITHERALLARLASRVLVMEAGRIAKMITD